VIDFRYHLVSIIAVFLALAIGIVVGSTELTGTTTAALRKAADAVTQRNNTLQQENKTLQQQLAADQAFAQAGAQRLTGHLLTGQSVVLITAPNSSSQMISQLIAAVQQAGGSVTGQVAFQPQFFLDSASTESNLDQLAGSLAPDAGVTLPGQPSADGVGGQEEAAQVIAAAIVTRGSETLGLPATEGQQVLSGFSQSGYLQISPQGSGNATTLATATMAIVVAPSSPPSSNDASPANLALIAVAEQLRSASSGTVLAGSQTGSGPGSAIDQISGTGKVTTVDNADQTVGQIITVQALAEQLTGHAPSSYGVGPGAVPSPAPTPSVSPTVTPTHQVKTKK
jgi:hypothetical protein